MTKLLLVSTFRHLFLGLSLAVNDESDWHVLFIDQKQDENENNLFLAVREVGSPFTSVGILSTRQKGESKKDYRKRTFSTLRDCLIELTPSEIITGNDRRLEFQYSMHFCRHKLNLSILGGYLDDGTGSYRNMYEFKKAAKFSDKYIDTPIKKIVYGGWYSRPETLGASSWIDRSYLCFPGIALPAIRGEKSQIAPSNYKSEPLRTIVERYMLLLGEESSFNSIKSVLFVLPHSSIIKELYGSYDALKRVVEGFIGRYPSAYVKYHPRELGDPLDLNGCAKLLQANIPAEMYLSYLNFVTVVGDVSTALMSAKWMQPNCDVYF